MMTMTKKHTTEHDHRVICILGMHRSGTSLVAQLLRLSGMFLGEESELLGAEANNQKGHWEHKEVLKIDESILAAFDGSWHLPPQFESGWENDSRLDALYDRARAFTDSMNQRAMVWGFKDPRACLTLPFWQKVIPDMTYVITVRNAKDVMQSLIKHHPSLPPRRGLQLWVQYWRSIFTHTASAQRTFTFFERYFTDWKSELGRVLTEVNEPALDFAQSEAEIAEFITPSLQHFNTKVLFAGNEPTNNEQLYLKLFQETDDALHDIVVESEDIIQQHILMVHQRDVQLQQKEQSLLQAKNIEDSLHDMRNTIETKFAQLQETVDKKDAYIRSIELGSQQQMQELTILKDQLHRILNEKNVQIRRMEKRFQQQTKKLAKLQAKTIKQDADIHEKEIHLHRQQLHIYHLEGELSHRDAELDRIHQSWFVRWRLRVRDIKLHNALRWSSLQALSRRAYDVYSTRGLKTTVVIFFKYVQHGRSYFQQHKIFPASYDDWIAKHEAYDREAVAAEIASFKSTPLISIIVPVYNIDIQWLNACIESVLEQYYPHWELCLHDDASTQKDNISSLKRWAKKDSRIKISLGKENQHISGASNEALKLATGDYIALLDADDMIAPHALYEVVKSINENPDAAMIYSDEDKIDTENHRSAPFFKPNWSPDLFLSMNYTSHLGVYKKSIVDEIGGFRKGYEGSQDYDLVLRFIERISESQIHHIPQVLYHWRQIPGSTATGVADNKSYALDSAVKALTDYSERNGINATITTIDNSGRYRLQRDIETDALVSILIPFKDEVEALCTCVESIFKKTHYPNYELVLINNQSMKQETAAYLAEIATDDRVMVLDYDKPFNYSAINNYAVAKARGDFLLLLNNDIEVIADGWLKAMMEHAQRPEVGAVGAKLIFPNETIQHAGITMGIGGVAGHAFKYLPRDADGYFSQLQVVRNTSGVTAACLLTRRDVFEAVGGLDEVNLTVGFNDVDFCLKIREAGYLIIYTPFAELYHYESLSRGNDDELYAQNPKKFERVLTEREYMRKKWKHVLEHDPYYNPNLSLVLEDYSLKQD